MEHLKSCISGRGRAVVIRNQRVKYRAFLHKRACAIVIHGENLLKLHILHYNNNNNNNTKLFKSAPQTLLSVTIIDRLGIV